MLCTFVLSSRPPNKQRINETERTELIQLVQKFKVQDISDAMKVFHNIAVF